MGQQAEKRYDRKNNRTRPKNKSGDSKVESNDSPEIPDMKKTSDIPGIPLGLMYKGILVPEYEQSIFPRQNGPTVIHVQEM